MATNRPTGMGYQTSLHFYRVANEIVSYVNSIHEYEALSSADDRWYDPYGTMKAGAERRRTHITHARPPTFRSTHMSRTSSSSTRRSVSRGSR
ncbi:unnamed protein product [Rotaria sp. Silwood1]|nr:unnamed protein product [Rotaria sp. Silwood1]CAF4563588.1 unnamed protein product [Rotaria sp. Silwood1]